MKFRKNIKDIGFNFVSLYQNDSIMNKNKTSIISKRIQCCIGILFLVPPVFGVIAFMLNVFGIDNGIVSMENLSGEWTAIRIIEGGNYLVVNDIPFKVAAAMSAAPIFLGIMAFVGAYLIKDNLKYLFTNED